MLNPRGLVVGMLLGIVAGACSPHRTFAEPETTGGAAGADQSAGGTSGSEAVAGTSSTPNEGGGSGSGGSTSPGDCSATQWSDGTACQDVSVCSDGEYEKGAPTSTSDRVCAPLTVCGAGSFVSTPPTAQSDRVCAPCAASSFSSVINADACAPWSTCEMGTTESVPPTLASDRVCSTCGAGKYEAAGGCVALTVCSSKQYETKAATAVSDRACEDLTSCKAGFVQTAAPTATTDRQCGACSQGTFSNAENALTCKAWSTCGANQKLSVAGTSTTDVVCVDKPVCSTASDRTCSVDCPCKSGEGVCTASNQCAGGSTCVSGSGKKVGRTGDTCLATHCNNDKQDSGESSVDCGGECGCRATFEIVTLTGIPADADGAGVVAMSRDGKRFGASISRGRTSYPGAVDFNGKLIELTNYGKWGSVPSLSADGSVLVGGLGCANPPSCSDTTPAIVQWVASAAPKVLLGPGSPVQVSSSGTIIVGGYYDNVAARNQVFLIDAGKRLTIPELSGATGLTPDGKYVAGYLQGYEEVGLWHVQTKSFTQVSSPAWKSTTLHAVNGTNPVVIGYGTTTADKLVGYRWKGGTLTELGLLQGGEYTVPAAVSLDGNTIVGVTGTNDYQMAFVWTEKNKLVSLADELASRGLELPVDLALKNAEFITDDGKTIVGVEYSKPPTFWRVVLN